MKDINTPSFDNVYHEGELEVQDRAGVLEQSQRIGNMMIKDHMPDQHRNFFSQLPMVFIGAADKQNDVWASVLFGEPGFIHSPDESQLIINQQLNQLEPLANQLQLGDDIGLLGLELETRRRNRSNMILAENNDQQMVLSVKQCFGNCPKYIQRRERIKVEHTEAPESIKFTNINSELREFITQADSFYIASRSATNNSNDDNIDVNNDNSTPEDNIDDSTDNNIKQRTPNNSGVDVSHRGGIPGFIKFNDAGELLIPDYAGNNLYNTLGNITKNPNVGLLFIDYDNSHLIMLTGEAHIVWAEDETLPFSKVDRMTRFRLKHGYHIKHSVPFRWSLQDYSPFVKTYEEA